ncbi:AMP-binding protein [Streptomyces sp. NPDC002851]
MRDGTGPDGLIHTGIARHAALHPDAPALIQGALRLSYRDLDLAAETYASELRRHGVGPGSLVPVALDRSPRLVTLLLGVLKCGAGYAALDPSWPRERLRTVVTALRPVVVVGAALTGLGVPVWEPEPEAELPVPMATPSTTVSPASVSPTSVSPTSVSPASTATVFFTSGTTGTPKGVLSPHRATTRLCPPDAPLAGLGPGRVMAQAAPVSWDAFTLEVWVPLLTGATCVMTEARPLLPEDLRELVRDHGVDTLWITASLFNLFVDEDLDCFTGLGHVLTGGEAASPAHIRRFLDRHPNTALFNGYGPVETCVFATLHRITPDDPDRPYGIPIGHLDPAGVTGADGTPGATATTATSLPGTRIHLIDGEICVSGDGLAAGYLGLPDATAERFTTITTEDAPGNLRSPSPPGTPGTPGTPIRVYRTGDLGTLDADGLLYFRGRTDRQVKISGHRVEPAETEAAARRVPGVRDCAAVPQGGRLALYYTPDPGAPTTPPAVRRALRAALPGHLVPHLVRELPTLPVTPNGKVDRSALTTEPPTPGSTP